MHPFDVLGTVHHALGIDPATEYRDTLDRPRRLVERYGAEAPRVLAHAAGDPALTEPVASGVPTLGVEIVHAVRCEGARDVEDVVERRTRIALVPAHLERAGPRVAEIVESCR